MADSSFERHMQYLEDLRKACYLPISQCVKRGIYFTDSRNLIITVYDGNRQFLGVRSGRWEGDVYITGETHWDLDSATGTAKPIGYLGMLPDNIKLPNEEGHVEQDLIDFLDNFKPNKL